MVESAYSVSTGDNELADQRRYSAIKAIVLSHLELLGPMTPNALADRLALSESAVTLALLALENAGSVFQLERKGVKYFVERAFYQRLLHYNRRPREGHARVSPANYLNFLQVWQNAAGRRPDGPPGDALQGPKSLRKVLRQLQGVALSQDEWVSALRLRVGNFSERMLEDLFLTGEFFWWRPATAEATAKSITAKTRYMILTRELWYKIAQPARHTGLGADALRIYEYLKQHGASFVVDIHHNGKLFTEQTLRGLRELIARGLITSDQFFALRRLSATKHKFSSRQSEFPSGRFARVIFPEETDEDTRAVAIAEMQLARQGVVYRYAAEKDFFKVPWPKFVKTLRLMEMRGLVRGGRFIEGLWGEQFAEPAAMGLLGNAAAPPSQLAPGDPVQQTSRLLAKLGVLAGEPNQGQTA